MTKQPYQLKRRAGDYKLRDKLVWHVGEKYFGLCGIVGCKRNGKYMIDNCYVFCPTHFHELIE